MKSRDMQIAEAVRDATLAGIGLNGRDITTEPIDLPAIIASIPAPEPVAWMYRLSFKDIPGIANTTVRQYRVEFPFGIPGIDFVAETHSITEQPLYTSPPSVEINPQLLDALNILVKFNARDWYDGAHSPVEIRIAKAAIAAAEKETGQ